MFDWVNWAMGYAAAQALPFALKQRWLMSALNTLKPLAFLYLARRKECEMVGIVFCCDGEQKMSLTCRMPRFVVTVEETHRIIFGVFYGECESYRIACNRLVCTNHVALSRVRQRNDIVITFNREEYRKVEESMRED